MIKFDIEMALAKMVEAKASWSKAKQRFDADYNRLLTRLLYEALAESISPREFGRLAGMKPSQVRSLMHRLGMHLSDSKRVLSEQASQALRENAALLNISLHDFDLMSPLAYLPMGETLRRELLAGETQGVAEVSGNLEARLRAAFTEPTGWLLAAEHVDEMVAHLLTHLESE